MTHGLDDLFRLAEPHEGPMIKQLPLLTKCLDLSGPQI